MNRDVEKYIIQKVKEEKMEMKKFNKEEIKMMIILGKKKKRLRICREITLATCVITAFIFAITLIFNTNLSNSNTPSIKAEENKNETSDKILYIYDNTDMLKDISDINVLKEDAHQIVIAKVDKIEGCTNYNEKTGNYTRINTLGDVEVLQVLKGDLSIGDKIPFIRGGGTISYEEYEKGMLHSSEYKENNIYEYVTERRKGDIEIEEGKTYLMFLYYDTYNERYEIMAYQYGLREYDINTKQVVDNDTNETQSIDDLRL